MGGTATAARILIIRELLVTFHGTELSIGVILANWLILEAAGSYWARKRALYSEGHVKSFALLQVSIGAGCILNEILKHPVINIDYTEQDPFIISCFDQFATPLTEYELNHEKVAIYPLEGRLYL